MTPTSYAKVLVDPEEWGKIQAKLRRSESVSRAAWNILNVTSAQNTSVAYNLLNDLRTALQSTGNENVIGHPDYKER